MSEPSRVSVRLLEKEYVVACPHEERADLLDSAEYLNSKMREIRDTGKVVGIDRIAVMAALNLANELLKTRQRDTQQDTVSASVGDRLRLMRERVETVLSRKGQQLEL
jgi:cell division protein ZapA